MLGLVTVAVLVGGCDKREETQTVEYYVQNDDARKAKIKECKDNPGELKNTPNCQNASKAHAKQLMQIKNVTASGDGNTVDKWKF